MPQLRSEQQDAVQEAISRHLYRINNYIKGMFGHDMDDDRIIRAHRNINQGVQQAVRQMEQRKNYTPLGGEPKLPARIPPEVEGGGFINEGTR